MALEYVRVSSGLVGLVTLNFDVIILTKNRFEPLNGGLSTGDVPCHDTLRQLTTKASRGTNNALVILLQKLLVDTSRVIERIRHESGTDYLAEIVVADLVLGKENKVPPGAVDNILTALAIDCRLVGHGVTPTASAIDLAAYNGLKRDKGLLLVGFSPLLSGFEGFFLLRLPLIFVLAIDLLAVVEQLFDAIHIAMVGEGYGCHTGSKALINDVWHLRHTVEYRIMGVDM